MAGADRREVAMPLATNLGQGASSGRKKNKNTQ
jgi:hypothetical protein